MNETKKWYKSLGLWAGVATILRGTYQAIRLSGLVALPEIPPAADAFLVSLFGAGSAYGRARATTKLN